VRISALPQAPTIVEGVINYRGTLVPVLDARARFGLSHTPLDPTQHFIVAQAGPRLVALRVDRATDLITVAEAMIRPVGEAAPGARYVAGIARLPDGLVVIHDLERFLALEEGEQLDHAMRVQASEAGARPRRAAS
jgi:purine-binding chemotaxis protein CheW